MTKKRLMYTILIMAFSTISFSFILPRTIINDITRAVGEVIQYTVVNTFKVVLPANYPYPEARDGSSTNEHSGDTCTTIVLEYGDGTFSTNFTSTHNYKQAPNGNLFASLTRYYDTTDMPDLYARNKNIINTSPNANSNTSLLSQNQSFDLVPHVSTIVPHDTTHFIIPFRNSASLFICFYNNEGSRFFSSIPSPNATMNINGLGIPFIRVHNGQNVFTNISQVPSNLFSGYPAQAADLNSFINSQQNSGFKFSDYFIIYNSVDTPRLAEKNMFFSLPPTSNYLGAAVDNNFTKVRLVNFDINSNKEKKANNIIVDKDLQFVARPRDPNNIMVNPGCLSAKSETHKATINFQNLGLGDVQDHIIIKTAMPDQVLQSVNLTEVVVGLTSIPISEILNGTNGHKIERISSGSANTPDTLVLTLKTTLDGLQGIPNGVLNPLTKGYFKFTLKPGLAASQMPYRFETDIIFDTEAPVHTYYKMDKCHCMPKAIK